MASIDKRRGKWRAQVRWQGHTLIKTFTLKHDAEVWVREAERAIDQQRDPPGSLFGRRVSKQDTFASLIDLHINDLHAHGKPVRRSKDAVLTSLRKRLGDVPVSQLTRERLIAYGRERARDGAGPATLSVDISFIGTVLTHAAAVHGLQVDTDAVRLARVALGKMGLVGTPKERDRRPTQDELDRLFAFFDENDRLTMPMTRMSSSPSPPPCVRTKSAGSNGATSLRTRTLLIPNRKDPRHKDRNPRWRAQAAFSACGAPSRS